MSARKLAVRSPDRRNYHERKRVETPEQWAALDVEALVFSRERWTTAIVGHSDASLVCETPDGVRVESERMFVSRRRGGWWTCTANRLVPSEWKGKDDNDEHARDVALDRARELEIEAAVSLILQRVREKVDKARHHVSPAGELERARARRVTLDHQIDEATETLARWRAERVAVDREIARLQLLVEPPCSCGWVDDPERAKKLHAHDCAARLAYEAAASDAAEQKEASVK